MDELNLTLLFKSLFRTAPVFLMIRTPLTVPVIMRIIFSLPLALILSQRLAQDYVTSVPILGITDLLLGLAVGSFIAMFFAAAMKISLFFGNVETGEEHEELHWRQVTDSFFFIFLMILFMTFKLERNILGVLAVNTFTQEKLFSLDVWAGLLTDLSWLALKMSSFGFLLVLTQRLFEEIYRRLGGESLRMVFSVCTWLALLIMSPLLIPNFSIFVGRELAEFWKKWLGVSL